MSDPIVFISHHRIKEGKLEGFKQFYQQGSELLRVNKPGTVVFLAYLDDDGTEVTIVHLFPDKQSMELHLQGADDRSEAAYEFLEPVRFEVYGRAPDTFIEGMKQIDGLGVTLSITPQPLGGFIRLRSG